MRGHLAFDQLLSSLNDAVLDDSLWPKAAELVDRACGSKGNILVWGEGGLGSDLKTYLARVCYRGERHEDFETEYFKVYHHSDERGPRLRRLPDSRVVSVRDLYTDEEKQSSVAYNEMLARSDTGNALHARLDGPGGSRIIWTAADPVDDAGWSTRRVETIRRILPHIRQFVRVRLALEDARALGSTITGLLENTRCGIVQLDARGRILAANGRALTVLRDRDGIMDIGGHLRARMRDEDARLQTLLGRALPSDAGGICAGGSIALTRSVGPQPRLVVHVSPVGGAHPSRSASRAAAIVLLVKAETSTVTDPKLVAEALGLTAAEARVASMLAGGHTLRDIARATGRTTGTVRWHVRQIYEKNRISRQAELVQLVRSLSIHVKSRG